MAWMSCRIHVIRGSHPASFSSDPPRPTPQTPEAKAKRRAVASTAPPRLRCRHLVCPSRAMAAVRRAWAVGTTRQTGIVSVTCGGSNARSRWTFATWSCRLTKGFVDPCISCRRQTSCARVPPVPRRHVSSYQGSTIAGPWLWSESLVLPSRRLSFVFANPNVPLSRLMIAGGADAGNQWGRSRLPCHQRP